MSRKLWPHPLDPETDAPTSRKARMAVGCLLLAATAATVITVVGWGRALWAMIS